MMYNYPFFSFPHFRRYPNYYSVHYPYVRQPIQNQSSEKFVNNINKSIKPQIEQARRKNSYQEKVAPRKVSEPKKERSSFNKRMPSGFSFLNNLLHQEDRNNDEEFFDVFGLKLYNDDLLLLGLIFFLYKEDVKDQYLFFALILLLLS